MAKPDTVARHFTKEEVSHVFQQLLPGEQCEVVNYQYLFGGLSTTTIKVDIILGKPQTSAITTVVLKIFYPNNPGIDAIQNAMDICNHVHANCPELPVTYALGDGIVREIKLSTADSFTAPATLVNYLPDTIAADRAIEKGLIERRTVMSELGHALAKLHSVPLPGNRDKLLMSYEQSGAVDLARHAKGDFVPDVVAKGNTEFTELYKGRIHDDFALLSNSRQTIIHGDPFLDNILLDSNRFTLSGLVDFEDACVGPSLFDLGSAIAGNCFDKDGLDWDSVSAFFAAYHAVLPLAANDLMEIPSYIRIALTCNAAFRFLTYYGTGNNDHAYLELAMKLDYMLGHREAIGDRFQAIA